MTKEKLEEGTNLYLEIIRQYIKDNGSLFPHFVAFGKNKDLSEEQPEFGIVQIPIDEEYMKDEETKDYLVERVIPVAAKKLAEKITCDAVGFAGEAWIRVTDKDEELLNWKKLPIKKEVIFINIESQDNSLFKVYNINRLGQQVNEFGELTDHVELEEDKELSSLDPSAMTGRMTGLFKRFTQL